MFDNDWISLTDTALSDVTFTVDIWFLGVTRENYNYYVCSTHIQEGR